MPYLAHASVNPLYRKMLDQYHQHSAAMGLAKALTECEQGQIDLLVDMGQNQSQIAPFLGRSRCVVRNYMKLEDDYYQLAYPNAR